MRCSLAFIPPLICSSGRAHAHFHPGILYFVLYEQFLGGRGGVFCGAQVAAPADARCTSTSNESVFPVGIVLICQDLGKGGIR